VATILTTIKGVGGISPFMTPLSAIANGILTAQPARIPESAEPFVAVAPREYEPRELGRGCNLADIFTISYMIISVSLPRNGLTANQLNKKGRPV
jgi:hypothetical protein